MAFDFKKEYKELYKPGKKPEIVNVPKANYIAVSGKGNPNTEGGEYQQAIGVLYTISYTLKMSYKTDYKIEGFFEYVVSSLEGFRWQIHHIGRHGPLGFLGFSFLRRRRFLSRRLCWPF